MLTKNKQHKWLSNIKSDENKGMTLIELMVILFIISVLAMMIFPSFEQHILNVRRGDGISHLLKLKVQQEAYRVQNNAYATAEHLSIPNNDYYCFVITNVSAKTFTIIAKAKESQLKDKHCLTMQINQSMKKTPYQCFF